MRVSLPSHTRIWVIGAMGLVGRAILDILLKEWQLPVTNIEAVGSESKSGSLFSYGGHDLTLKYYSPDMFAPSERHVLLLATSSDVSTQWVGWVKDLAHVSVIDASSAFRMRQDVPLVIPEHNAHVLEGTVLEGKPRLVASPNCTTIGFLVGIAAFWKHFDVRRIHVCTYQSASGAGYPAYSALEQDLREGTRKSAEFFRFPLSHNCIPQIGAFNDAGFTQEEEKIRLESHKILNTQVPIHVTCARVPVGMGHSESVTLEVGEPLTQSKIKSAIEQASDPDRVFASPLYDARSLHEVINTNKVIVSRVRIQPEDPQLLHLWIQFDNIRIGAATNVCRILAKMLNSL